MIQATLHPASSAIPLNAGLRVTQAEDGANPADFASILAVTMTAGPDKAPAAALPAETSVPATPKAILQLAGKATGKSLPLPLPEPTPEPGPELGPEAGETVSEPAEAAASPDENDLASAERPGDALALAALPAVFLVPMKDAPLAAKGPLATDRAHDPLSRSKAVTASLATDKAAPSAFLAVAPDTEPTAKIAHPPLAASETAAAAAPAMPAETRPARKRATADMTVIRVNTGITPETPATAASSADAEPGRDTDTPAAPATPPGAHKREPQVATRGIADAAPASPAAPAATDRLPDAPIAAELQPMLAMRDAQPVVTSSPQTAPAAIAQPSGHDFAALIDRLVEAREGSAPQSVEAAVSHTDFGQVSLRFDHDDNGLTVAMTSADPDFAPAVQAAAPSSQAGNDNLSQSRHDSPSPHSGAAFAGQQQSSARGPQQIGGTGNVGRGPDHEPRDGDRKPSDRRSGIYA
jgi:hypothetical protein